MLERKQLKDRTQITFVLPADTPPGPVSVVGDFNDWQPGTHTLEPRKDGMRAVTVALPGESAHSFRYLAADDCWFDEDPQTATTASTAACTPDSETRSGPPSCGAVRPGMRPVRAHT